MTLPTSGPLTLGDIQTEFGGSNPIAMNEYYAGGSYVPAGTTGTYGAVPSSGQISVQNFYGTTAFTPVYIEEVFSTWLYTGTGAAQTITNGINLSTNGGLVWTKTRSGGAGYDWHVLVDSARGVTKVIETNLTDAEATQTDLTAFTTTGYNLSAGSYYGNFNFSGAKFVSWTFRKQPKFFDVVTFTSNSSKPPNTGSISHNLGSTPGCILVKSTSGSQDWKVYHRSTGTDYILELNSASAKVSSPGWITVSSTTISFPGTALDNSVTYVAYLFAHDAGGFGLTGTDNVISCGSYTGNGSTTGPTVTLGYEPQWLMIKNASDAGSWQIIDNMRGMYNGSPDQRLIANIATTEYTNEYLSPTATGFNLVSDSGEVNGNGNTMLYIAIRRGPMKVPTDATKVFYPNAIPNGNTLDSSNVPFPPDLVNSFSRNGTDRSSVWDLFLFADRLRGLGTPNNTLTASAPALISSSTGAENTSSSYIQLKADGQNITRGTGWSGSLYGDFIYYFWRRAPSFFDEVCYTGTGSGTTITHNLGVTPELVITKSRTNGSLGWVVWTTSLTNTDYWIRLDSTMDQTNSPVGYGGTFSASNYTIANTGPYGALNGSGQNFVAYLFATCAGVSKVGSYTGNGTTQTINCGFTTGARFVLIKRTDLAGGWYTYDTARGMTTLTDPYLFLNSASAEVATLGSVTTVSTGFALNSAILADINVSSGTYIFLAIA